MRRGLALGLIFLLLLTGCWNRVEVNDLGVVTAMAVDVGFEKPVRLSLYIARATGGASRQNAGGSPIWLASREAENLSEAVEMISMASPRRISLHHVRTVVIGEEYARKDISDVLDFLIRNPQIRLNARPMVAHGHAYEIFEVEPELETLQSEVLSEVIPAMSLQDNRLKEFLVARVSLTHTGWMYALRLRERPAQQPRSPGIVVEQYGAGFFLQDRMVAWATPSETRHLLWLLGNGEGSVSSMKCPGRDDRSLSGTFHNPAVHITPVLQGSSLTFHVAVRANINLIRSQCDMALVERKPRSQVEQIMEQEVRTHMSALISRMQSLGIDPVGFGKRVQMAEPAYWRSIAADWISAWRKASVRVSADLTIGNTGLLARPGNRTEIELQKK